MRNNVSALLNNEIIRMDIRSSKLKQQRVMGCSEVFNGSFISGNEGQKVFCEVQ